MGDAGSNFLGFLLGALTVVGTFTREGYSPFSVLAPLLVMAVPLYDMSSVILIRLREGRSPFKGDRRHFSHRLVARGLTPPQAVWTIDLVTLAGGLGRSCCTGSTGSGPRWSWPRPLCLLGVVAILEFSAKRYGVSPMARRGARSSVPPNPRKASRADARREPMVAGPPRPLDRDEPDAAGMAARAGELVRRAALGLTAALVAARAYTTSEPDMEYGAGAGLYWVLALLIVAGVAIAAGLIGGRFRFRWSWADAAVVTLMVLVAFSSRHALDRRPAINLAWEWIALGVAYLLLRNLPRIRDESSILAGALVATAFAVSVYGLYQVAVELPALQAQFRRNPAPMLAQQGIEPNTSAAARFENRLMQSTEPWSTFALGNSLAGFIVGPLVLLLAVWFHNLSRREPAGSRWPALFMAAPVILILIVCLLLTKSRSAYIGLLVGVGIVAWRERRAVSARLLTGAAVALCAIVAALVTAGMVTGKLDREVLTQSSLSMRYRWEYWQATWGVITGGATNGLKALKAAVLDRWGVGPGNFRTAYVLLQATGIE